MSVLVEGRDLQERVERCGSLCNCFRERFWKQARFGKQCPLRIAETPVRFYLQRNEWRREVSNTKTAIRQVLQDPQALFNHRAAPIVCFHQLQNELDTAFFRNHGLDCN